jgi:hypothetical protein
MRPGLHACRLPNHRGSRVVGQFRRRGRARHHVVGTGSGSTLPSVAGWDRGVATQRDGPQAAMLGWKSGPSERGGRRANV